MMKKTRKFKTFFGMAVAVSVCCILSSNPAYSAGPTPTDIYNQGKYEQGASSLHDIDMMKYDKEGRSEQIEYNQYNQRRYGTGGSAVKNTAAPNNDYMKATIDEIGTKGVYINSIEVSPSEILS
jgi:hypothetical protein